MDVPRGQLYLGETVDPATHQRTGTPVLLAASDLTTHGVIVGMTGSGKTGLGIVMIEEAVSSGIPVIAIDPKGDLGNLLLTFPDLAAEDFRPWINDGDAQRAGVEAGAFAAQTAEQWRDGLASWGITGERMRALRAGARFTIYTPGSMAGVPLNVIGSLQAPEATDAETVSDEVQGFVSGLLGLVGLESDPLSSREHILLTNLVAHEWAAGRDLDLATLVGLVQRPPLRKLGVFDLDTFFPPRDRTSLALRLNGLLASPAFSAWGQGEPLDPGALLRAEDGRPRCAVVTTAHLSDEERQFVTATLLGKVVTWMRRQPGTTDLRALIYMDEVMGYVPPVANPPAKQAILTMLKQARAFGVGMVLATQNPVDVDYKALSNAGTWIVGRLQTEQDKVRLLDGMSNAAGGVDVDAVSATIGGLAKREFVLRRAGKDRPEVMTSRWSMSYLRGPLTREQIATLTDASSERAAPVAPRAAPSHPGDDTSPVVPATASGIPVRWVDAAASWAAAVGASAVAGRHEAALVARVALLYDDEKSAVRKTEEYELVVHPLGAHLDPSAGIAVDYDDRDLRDVAPLDCTYVLPDAPIGTKAWWTDAKTAIVDHLVASRTLAVPVNRALKLYGRPGETLDAFAVRCDGAAQDRADAEAAKLRSTYETKIRRAQDALEAAQDKAEELEDAARRRRREEVVTGVGDVLGSFLGGRRRTRSITSAVGRATKSRSRSAQASQRVETAGNRLEDRQEALDALERELTDELIEIDGRWRAAADDVETLEIPLERSDVRVQQLVLAWLPLP